MRAKLVLLLLLALLSCLFAVASAEEEAAIEIYDRAGLEAIALNPSGNYILKNDIDLDGADWLPIAFSGQLDGAGHALYNMRVRDVGAETGVSVDGNGKKYKTRFAGLFSRLDSATVKNLTLLNADVNVTTEENCFAACLSGYAERAKISGCTVSGRVYLYAKSKICGVAGFTGFGYGKYSDSKADVTLVLVDQDAHTDCEEFLGGVVACGYPDIDAVNVKLNGYTSVHGYVHNGGLVGMHRIHNSGDAYHKSIVKNCEVDIFIAFFEHVKSRRAYCKAYVGESLNYRLKGEANKKIRFEKVEVKRYDKPLLPERCETPSYTSSVTQPTCASFGYTTFTCEGCGYAYTDDYVAPAHVPGAYVEVTAPDYQTPGTKARFCTLCGAEVDRQSIPCLRRAEKCALSAESLRLNARDSVVLQAAVEPADASDTRVTWTSSDSNVARVDENGLVTAVRPGSAQIQCVTADGYAEATCAVQVRYAWWQWGIVVGLFGWIWY